MADTPLWDAAHPYRCEPGNYRASSCKSPEVVVVHESWADFRDFRDPEMIRIRAPRMAAGYYDSDRDLNLVFRWDWVTADPCDYEPGETVPNDALYLFVVLQRKADLRTIIIRNVTHDDEPEIRAWLAERAKTIASIWAPIDLSTLPKGGS